MSEILRSYRAKRFLLIFAVVSFIWVICDLVRWEQYIMMMQVCSRCRIVGSESLKEVSLAMDNVEDVVLSSSEVSVYVKQVEVLEEDGTKVMFQDQYVLKGLTEFSSIKKSSGNIFFAEISCVGDNSILRENYSKEWTLDAYQACAVESAARANPDRRVYLLHSCPLQEDFALVVPEHSQALLGLPNLLVVNFDPWDLFEIWPHPLPLVPSIVGLLALWRFGGTYLGLDSLVLRPLRPLGTDYCGFQEGGELLSEEVLGCRPAGPGHSVVDRVLLTLSETKWPEHASAMTTSVNHLCDPAPDDTPREDCDLWTVYDTSVLFPMGWPDVVLLLNEDFCPEFLDRLKASAYVLTHYSRLFIHPSVRDGPTHVFRALAQEFCPDVFRRNNQFLYSTDN